MSKAENSCWPLLKPQNNPSWPKKKEKTYTFSQNWMPKFKVTSKKSCTAVWVDPKRVLNVTQIPKKHFGPKIDQQPKD